MRVGPFSPRTRAGEVVSGERLADSVDAAVAMLRREQILVTKINASKGSGGSAAAAKSGGGVKVRG